MTHLSVPKCQTVSNRWFIHLGMGSWWIWLLFFMVSPRSNVQRPSHFRWGFPSCRRKQSWPTKHQIQGSIWLDPCQNCHGQTCPISSTKSAVLAMAPNFVLKNSDSKLTCAGIRWHKTQVDSAVLSSFIWGSLLIWNPKTSFTWIRRQNSDGWFGNVEGVKHQRSSTIIKPSSSIINQHQPMLTLMSFWPLNMETSWRAGAPGNLEEDVKTDRNDLVENDPATHGSKSVFKLLHYTMFVETCCKTGSSKNMWWVFKDFKGLQKKVRILYNEKNITKAHLSSRRESARTSFGRLQHWHPAQVQVSNSRSRCHKWFWCQVGKVDGKVNTTAGVPSGTWISAEVAQ